MASFYTFIDNDKDAFGEFLSNNAQKYESELLGILGRLKNMGVKNGALRGYFKLDEASNNDEKIVCYYDVPDSKLRIFCIRFSVHLVVLCGGGAKPKTIISWQQSNVLRKAAESSMNVSKLIDTNIEKGLLNITANKLNFSGKLELN